MSCSSVVAVSGASLRGCCLLAIAFYLGVLYAWRVHGTMCLIVWTNRMKCPPLMYLPQLFFFWARQLAQILVWCLQRSLGVKMVMAGWTLVKFATSCLPEWNILLFLCFKSVKLFVWLCTRQCYQNSTTSYIKSFFCVCIKVWNSCNCTEIREHKKVDIRPLGNLVTSACSTLLLHYM